MLRFSTAQLSLSARLSRARPVTDAPASVGADAGEGGDDSSSSEDAMGLRGEDKYPQQPTSPSDQTDTDEEEEEEEDSDFMGGPENQLGLDESDSMTSVEEEGEGEAGVEQHEDYQSGVLSQVMLESQEQQDDAQSMIESELPPEASSESHGVEETQVSLPDGQFLVDEIIARGRWRHEDSGDVHVWHLVVWQRVNGRVDTTWETRETLENTDALRAYEEANGGVLAEGGDDGLKRVRQRAFQGQGYRISIETPAAGNDDKKRKFVELLRSQLTPAGVALADAYEKRGKRPRGAAGGSGDGGDGGDGGGDAPPAQRRRQRRPAAAGRDAEGNEAPETDDEGDGEEREGPPPPPDDDDNDDDDDGDGGGDGGGGGGGDGGGPARPAGRGKFLQWSANTSDFQVSITRTIRDGVYDPNAPQLRAAMREYTVTRLWLLECVCPPGPAPPSDDSIRDIAKAYYQIEEKAFLSGFRAAPPPAPTKQEHEDAEVDAMVRRARRRWTRMLQITATERATLRSYLKALDRIDVETAPAGAAAPPNTADDPNDPLQKQIVAQWRAGDRQWYQRMHAPVARTTRQNNLVRYRNAEIKRLLGWTRTKWYDWQGARSEQQRRADTLGSPFTGDRPTSWEQAAVTPIDHTVAQSYFENTELIGIFSRAREDMVNTQPVPKYENEKKGNAPIMYLSVDPYEPQPDHSTFEPRELLNGGAEVFTERRQAVTARRVVYTYLSYGLVTEQHDANSGLGQQGKGCGYYAIQRIRQHMERIVRENAPAQHERDVNWMQLFALKTWNPLLEKPNLLQDGEFATEYRQLFQRRLDGHTELPWLCGLAIRSAVGGFPV